ncbi:T9SS type A sorting domain-containing protein [Bacteroidota bacterium]
MKKILPFVIGILIPFGSLSAQLTASINDSTNLSCFEAMDGTAKVTILGGTPSYKILWDDDSLTEDATATDLIAERWYRVTVTDAVFAEAKDSVMLSQPDEIIYELEGLKTIQCHGPAEGYIQISSSGGTGPHSYKWNGVISSDSIYNLTAGKHYFEVIDSTGCSVNDSLILEEADKVEIVIDSVFHNICLGQSRGKIYTSASGGQPTYDYLWTGPSEFTDTAQDITGLIEGVYKLELTDARGCVYKRDASILDGDPITVTYSLSHFRDYNLICTGDSSGSIQVDTVAGNGADWKNYKYIWTGPNGYKAYTHVIEDLKAGNYHLNVFDFDTCRSDVTITLTQPPPIGIQYDSIVSNPCLDDQESSIYISILNGIEPFTYSWTGPDAFTSDSRNITNLSKGNYMVSVFDSDQCNSTSDTTLIQVDNIELILAVSEYGDYNVSCPGSDDGVIKIQNIPGYTDLSGFDFYTTGPNGFVSRFRFMTSGIKAGSYHITATDPLGCSGEKDTILTEPHAIETGDIIGDTVFVHDSDYVYTVDGGFASSTFNWEVEGGEVWTGQGSKSVEIEWRSTTTGKVRVIETTESGCKGDTVFLPTSIYKEEVIDPGTGINDLANSIIIYPNPIRDILIIEGLDQTDGRVEIFSLLGRMVLQLELSSQLNLEALDNGVYYLRITTRDGNPILTRKIIKK